MNEMLKYQDIDLEIKKIESEIMNSDDRRKATQMQNMLKNLQENLSKLEATAKQVNERYIAIEKVYGDALKKLEQLNKTAGGVGADKIDDVLASSKALVAGTVKLEKEIMSLSKQSDDIVKEFDSVMKNARIAKKNLMIAKEGYDKVRASFEPKLIELRKKLAEQEKKVDKKLLAKYHAKQSGKITQVFVPLKDGRCGGCRMEIPAGQMKKLTDNGYMECENCGRIIFIAK